MAECTEFYGRKIDKVFFQSKFLFDLMLYLHSKQLRSCWDGQLLNKGTVPGQAYHYSVHILLPVTDNLLFLNQPKRKINYFFHDRKCQK